MHVLVTAADRAASEMPGVRSRHCFSFGDHYAPANTHHGVLLACNDESVAAGRGFDTHPHRAVEIVTWVLGGALVHQDSEGHAGVVYPGLAQRMSAGTGILHSERNDRPEPAGAGVRFVQMWLAPDDASAAPSYEQREVSADVDRGGLVTVASGDPARDAAIRIGARGATLHCARLAPGATVDLPEAPFGHLYVAAGSAVADGTGALVDGDSLRTIADGIRITAGAGGAELLYWEMHRRLGD
ncbi:Pirin domain protein OS=Tsukamurella paurometabola (strain ATCC 8368 / DSM / CCUG 35730 / CIP 100753 / JCM 10117 / KCTC 9821 / NBRC 16120 / NCIMB 702349/ NCTC 13040) OX=521096 GN=Tpau_0348 PE=3 SV=1 [Tsukamurella paurometabola]|uniref:Pirin domain protein n=1 Tax=Tsukamurella paurometabola (strain ATCC 8368 / DSM 20162 / CCUG 35730 / CIP 100753 / JCM 10117 / KCTC 9821 / NBRC 16120 / NCIMB 702349 / NCTC 13040) TaxID=521096 RepID=D5URD8_TSUPD|nr:pirin family protein [Tsukamurella paurometabola]ADG76991.1 Pirin domain protein [Tsukamurella paurometabola DSM 20162]SUP42386.1 Quercetin 2,3-dioxygenase [Tsukamurella paurometabola]